MKEKIRENWSLIAAYLLVLAVIVIGGMQGCTIGATGTDAATAQGVPWYENIQNWTPYQKANFFMDTWRAENAAYKTQNALENKSPELVTLLKTKRQVLEQSRIPVRLYVSLVKAGGTADQDIEQEIIGWIRQLQAQALTK